MPSGANDSDHEGISADSLGSNVGSSENARLCRLLPVSFPPQDAPPSGSYKDQQSLIRLSKYDEYTH